MARHDNQFRSNQYNSVKPLLNLGKEMASLSITPLSVVPSPQETKYLNDSLEDGSVVIDLYFSVPVKGSSFNVNARRGEYSHTKLIRVLHLENDQGRVHDRQHNASRVPCC